MGSRRACWACGGRRGRERRSRRLGVVFVERARGGEWACRDPLVRWRVVWEVGFWR